VSLSPEERTRYARHLALPEIAVEGQERLKSARVLVIGAGGLGSPSALYLAAAGIGTLGLVDDDVVDESNLQRQVLHWTSSVGTPKTESGRRTLFEVNPDVKVRTHNLRLNASNVEEIFADYDVILSGSDNFATAYLVNDAAVLMKKPVAYGSIFRFDGQVSTFIPHEGPCYRCLYPVATPPELAPSCAEAGVLGVLPGTIGMIQATEVIKLLLGIGESLKGRLLVYDALGQTFREFKIRRDPKCQTCGENARIELRDYADPMCAVGQ
jgi:molybdopterin/thiamine biosynthesis adenylyltransferase